MGQVPARILIVGNGRLAKTLWGVVHAPDFPSGCLYSRWARGPEKTGAEKTDAEKTFGEALEGFDATHIWLAISDRALLAFTSEHQSLLKSRTVVHFAGSLAGWPGVHAAHPLTTFNGQGPHTFAWFSKIPFILDADTPDLEPTNFAQLMPGFTNPAYRIARSQRAYYHALCATAGNFSVLLWETVASRFESEFNLPHEALTEFRRQIFKNLDDANGASVLTGPLVRGDTETLQSHRSALLSRYEAPLIRIYDSFTDLFRTERTRREKRS